MDTSEKNFEVAIEAWLISANGNYRQDTSEEYDPVMCLLPRTVLDFIYSSQPKEWEKLKRQYGKGAEDHFLKRLASEIEKRGTVDVLRKGVKDTGALFKLVYFRPATGLNPDAQRAYQANIFTVIRQVYYSQQNNKSLDMVLFLNGLPIFTAELKNQFTNQNVEDAIRQYKTTRDPREPLFAVGRCVAHFAVDPELVYWTSVLEGTATRFLPFNQGRYGGAGNPPNAFGFATAYLWEDIWARDSVLNLLQQFVMDYYEEEDKGHKTRQLIFPRYHQLDAVRRLIAHARENGTGQRYLIQHSAGSGKSNSIGWLAHQLSSLHDENDQRVFDSILVITDRRVLDKQLQTTVLQFEQTLGLVENIDKTSRQLKEALENGKQIIVTTLQKFPVIAEQMKTLSGQRFAVIIDEAHSSQSGDSSKSWKKVLSINLEDDQQEEFDPDPETVDETNSRALAEQQERGQLPNVSIFAFTATPKQKTLELFGQRNAQGKYEAFSLYSMRQAIEEHFILDVLQNYTTFSVYWHLLKTIEDDPRYDRNKATFLLKSFVDSHPHAIETKVAIMVDHFVRQSANQINGKAKAMIVTRSRLSAVLYKLAVDEYLKKQGYSFKALVAFSGTITDSGKEYTENSMNGFSDTQTAETFKRDDYRILIVANKFQTGFDQPLLHTMYIDRKLGGVHAVQTLSRLNRIYPGKDDTVVLDFANTAEEIQKAFEPFYEKTLLAEATDPNLLYDIQQYLENFHVYESYHVDQFAEVYFKRGTQDKLYYVLAPAVERYEQLSSEEKGEFRSTLAQYTRTYSFLSQIITFSDAELEKLYVFARLLSRRLPFQEDRLPNEVQQNIDIESYRVQQTSSGKISLERGKSELAPLGNDSSKASGEALEALSRIISDLNKRFGTDFTEADKVSIHQIETQLAANDALATSVRINSRDNARLTFDHVMDQLMQEIVASNFKLYKLVNDNPDAGKAFKDILFNRYVDNSNQGL